MDWHVISTKLADVLFFMSSPGKQNREGDRRTSQKQFKSHPGPNKGRTISWLKSIKVLGTKVLAEMVQTVGSSNTTCATFSMNSRSTSDRTTIITREVHSRGMLLEGRKYSSQEVVHKDNMLPQDS